MFSACIYTVYIFTTISTKTANVNAATVRFALSQTNSVAFQRIIIGLYILLYLFPVGYVVMSKVKVASSTSNIEEGTFCFKPARSVRITQANFYAMAGFVFEWIQHILYVLPLGIVASEDATKLSDFPPYLSFEVYFWGTIACTFAAGLVIVLNAELLCGVVLRVQCRQPHVCDLCHYFVHESLVRLLD